MTAPAEAWRSFRRWRRSRPFWGGLLHRARRGGDVRLHPDDPQRAELLLQVRPTGFYSLLIPSILVTCGLLLWLSPGPAAVLLDRRGGHHDLLPDRPQPRRLLHRSAARPRRQRPRLRLDTRPARRAAPARRRRCPSRPRSGPSCRVGRRCRPGQWRRHSRQPPAGRRYRCRGWFRRRRWYRRGRWSRCGGGSRDGADGESGPVGQRSREVAYPEDPTGGRDPRYFAVALLGARPHRRRGWWPPRRGRYGPPRRGPPDRLPDGDTPRRSPSPGPRPAGRHPRRSPPPPARHRSSTPDGNLLTDLLRRNRRPVHRRWKGQARAERRPVVEHRCHPEAPRRSHRGSAKPSPPRSPARRLRRAGKPGRPDAGRAGPAVAEDRPGGRPAEGGPATVHPDRHQGHHDRAAVRGDRRRCPPTDGTLTVLKFSMSKAVTADFMLVADGPAGRHAAVRHRRARRSRVTSRSMPPGSSAGCSASRSR